MTCWSSSSHIDGTIFYDTKSNPLQKNPNHCVRYSEPPLWFTQRWTYQEKGGKKVGLKERRQSDWSRVKDQKKEKEKKKKKGKPPSYMWFVEYKILSLLLWFSPTTLSPITITETNSQSKDFAFKSTSPLGGGYLSYIYNKNASQLKI